MLTAVFCLYKTFTCMTHVKLQYQQLSRRRLVYLTCSLWQGLYLPDREASLIKEYCRLKCIPTLPTSDPYLEQNLTSKGEQANWRPSLGLWGSASLWVNKPPLHRGGVPSHQRPSLVASLHSQGRGRETRFWSRWLTCRFTSLEVGVIWLLADGWLGQRPPGPMPQLQGGMRHGFKVSRFPDSWPFQGGTGILPKAALAVPGVPWVWSFRAL